MFTIKVKPADGFTATKLTRHLNWGKTEISESEDSIIVITGCSSGVIKNAMEKLRIDGFIISYEIFNGS